MENVVRRHPCPPSAKVSDVLQWNGEELVDFQGVPQNIECIAVSSLHPLAIQVVFDLESVGLDFGLKDDLRICEVGAKELYLFHVLHEILQEVCCTLTV